MFFLFIWAFSSGVNIGSEIGHNDSLFSLSKSVDTLIWGLLVIFNTQNQGGVGKPQIRQSMTRIQALAACPQQPGRMREATGSFAQRWGL